MFVVIVALAVCFAGLFWMHFMQGASPKKETKQVHDVYTQTEIDNSILNSRQEETDTLQKTIQQLRISLSDSISSMETNMKEKQLKIEELNEQLAERQSAMDELQKCKSELRQKEEDYDKKIQEMEELQIACERFKSQVESLTSELEKFIRKEQERLASEVATSEANNSEKPQEESIPVEKEQSEEIKRRPSYEEPPTESIPTPGTPSQTRVLYFKEAVKELVQTEQDYINDMLLVDELYFGPLSKNPKLISPEDFSKVFSNLLDIVNLNKQFLEELKVVEIENLEKLGGVILKYADFFKTYSVYVSNQTTAMAVLDKLKKNKTFSTFLLKAQTNPKCRLLPFDSFLSKPMQRITKYPLLLKEILKNTSDTKPGYSVMKTAFDKLTDVVTSVNEKIRTMEKITRVKQIGDMLEEAPNLVLVEPSRVFEYEGDLVWIMDRASQKDVHVFVFNDCLLITRSTSKKQTYQFKEQLFFADTVVKELIDPCLIFPTTLIKFSDGKWSLQEKVKWVSLLSALMSRIQAAEERRQRRRSTRDLTEMVRSAMNLKELVYKEGYLEKLHGTSWKKRYFLCKDSVLYRFDVKGGKVLGKLLLAECSIEEYQPDTNPSCFQIRTPSKSIVLRAESEEEMHNWLNTVLKHKLMADASIKKNVEVVGDAQPRASFKLDSNSQQ